MSDIIFIRQGDQTFEFDLKEFRIDLDYQNLLIARYGWSRPADWVLVDRVQVDDIFVWGQRVVVQKGDPAPMRELEPELRRAMGPGFDVTVPGMDLDDEDADWV